LMGSGLAYYHFTKESGYEDYIDPLSKLHLFDAVLDRHALCEYPYSKCMNRDFKFTMKQWHNILLLTLIQNPVIVLCTHKPLSHEYKKDQYLPYDKWDECLRLYKEFLTTHHIPHTEYDYGLGANPKAFIGLEKRFRESISWWKPMWEAGCGAIGSTNPKVLLVAERLGPNNMNNIPFETGPTGYMLTDMLYETGTPLGKVTLTNIVKSFRKDPRPPNEEDLDLLHMEIKYLKPEKVVFMGTPAKQGIKVANEMGVKYAKMVHLGYYKHQGITDMKAYHGEWRRVMDMIPKLEWK